MRDEASIEEVTMTEEDFLAALDGVLARQNIMDRNFILVQLVGSLCTAYSIVRGALFKEITDTDFIKLMDKNEAMPFTEGFLVAMARELKKLSLREKEKGTVQ